MQQAKMTDLKTYLPSKNHAELLKEILILYKLFPNVKEYYSVNLVPNAEQGILEKYKKIIKTSFSLTEEWESCDIQ